MDLYYDFFSLFENYTYETHYEFDYNDAYEMKLASTFTSAVCQILIFCISMPGNVFLLCVLLKEQAWKTTSDILLLQLLISDLCLTVSLPFWAYSFLHSWIFGDWMCRITLGASFLGLKSYVLILTAMTLHSYVVVAHYPCVSAQAPQKLYVLVTSISIWLVCAAVSISVSMNAMVIYEFGGEMCLNAALTLTKLSHYRQIGIFFLIPAIIITFCCVHMCITIKKCTTNRRQHSLGLIWGMVVVFFLCLVPYNIILFIKSLVLADVLEFTTELSQATNTFVLFIGSVLPVVHCCLNPLLHIFGAQRFRRHLAVPCKTSLRGDGSHNLTMEVHPL